MGLLRPNRSVVDPRFLLYAYLGPEFQATLKAKTIPGSTVDRILLTELPDFPISVPSLDDQRAIGSILGALDDKIDLNRRMNETLESMTRAIFKSWFVDFDPVRAKVEGRQPAGMDAETAALFPVAFDSSGLANVPRGWGFRPVGDVVRVVGGSTPRTENAEYWSGAIPFATPKDLSLLVSPVLLETERCITQAGLEQIGSGLLPSGTVLLSSRAPIGYLAIATMPVCVNQGFVAMICEGEIPNHYALLWAKQNMDEIVGRANGTTFLEISKANFRPIPMLVPNLRALERFEQTVKPAYAAIENNARQSVTLTQLRDSLLPKLLSGELRIRDAEKQVEALV
jgi:type I restriction enzyme S subunit